MIPRLKERESYHQLRVQPGKKRIELAGQDPEAMERESLNLRQEYEAKRPGSLGTK